MSDYNPFVYFEDKTIIVSKVIMVTDIYRIDTSPDKKYGFSIMVEGLNTPLSYTSLEEQVVIDKRKIFMTSLRRSLSALNNWYE